MNIISIIGFIATLGGLGYSYFAFKEARQAKNAAQEAGQVVKRQSIALEISEICFKCKLNTDISYPEVMQRYEDINNGIQKIIGLYLRHQDETCKIILSEEIEKTLSEIKVQLNALNPVKPEKVSGDEVESKFYYYQFFDLFITLSGALNKLRGALEDQLIDKK
jgi:hypothetical protein